MFLSPEGSPFERPEDVVRSTAEEKDRQIDNVTNLRDRNEKAAAEALERLQRAAIDGDNTFGALMNAVTVCSLAQLSSALYAVGGRYRRNM
jgi:methylmalonyl-CoA mutase